MRAGFLLGALLLLGAPGLVACGGEDEASSSSGPPKKKAKAGSGGESGSSAEGGSGGAAGTPIQSGGFPSNGGAGAGGSGGTTPSCVTNPPALPSCDAATGCQKCICDKCADAVAACAADEACSKAVACVAAGCSVSQCASLTSGEASLARAEAVQDCSASKNLCRAECTGGKAGAAGAAGAAGQGGSGGSGGEAAAGKGGSGGSAGGQGGSPGVDSPQCCQTSEMPGCKGLPVDQLSTDELLVEQCVCAQDNFCCQNKWDETCVKEVGEFGCAPACPEGSAGAGGSAGSGGSGGEGQAGTGGSSGSGGSGGSGGSAGSGDECPPLQFPSVSLQTKKDPELTALYEALGSTSCETPVCFLDASDLRSADGTPVGVKVNVSANFKFYELVRINIDPKGTGDYDPVNAHSARVLLSPELVEKLQKLREITGAPVVVTSGYRSPQHQKALCQGICGADQCTDGSGAVTCAKNSRHLWGAAADVDLKYEAAAQQAGFAFVIKDEGGSSTHLHLDMLSCQ